MSFKPFRKIRVVDQDDVNGRTLNLLQDNVAQAFGQLLGKDPLDVTLLTNVVLGAGQNVVAHKLGRRLLGWLVVRTHGGYPQIYDVQDTNPSPNLTLLLQSATKITVDLLVF